MNGRPRRGSDSARFDLPPLPIKREKGGRHESVNLQNHLIQTHLAHNQKVGGEEKTLEDGKGKWTQIVPKHHLPGNKHETHLPSIPFKKIEKGRTNSEDQDEDDDDDNEDDDDDEDEDEEEEDWAKNEDQSDSIFSLRFLRNICTEYIREEEPFVLPAVQATEEEKGKEEIMSYIPRLHTSDPEYSLDYIFVVFTLERMILCGALGNEKSETERNGEGEGDQEKEETEKKESGEEERVSFRERGLRPTHIVDMIRFTLLITAFFFVLRIELSIFSSFLEKGLFKLRALVIVVETMDGVMAAFGTSILKSLFWQGENLEKKFTKVVKFVATYLYAVLYLVLHCSFLLLHLAVLTAAISRDNSLFSLLIVLQVAELKSAVKKQQENFDENKMKKLCYGDIYERFKLTVLLFLLILSHPHLSLRSLWMIFCIALSEVMVDSLKHVSLAIVTRTSPLFYTRISSDFLKSFLKSDRPGLLSDWSLSVSKQLGLFPHALFLVALKVFVGRLSEDRQMAFLQVIGFLVVSFVLKRVTTLTTQWLAKRHKVLLRLEKLTKVDLVRDQHSTYLHSLLLLKPTGYKQKRRVYLVKKMLRTGQQEQSPCLSISLPPNFEVTRRYSL